MTTNNLKAYAKRDSATSVLRKMGVEKEKYNDFITVDKNQVYLDLSAAEAYLAAKMLKEQESAAKKSLVGDIQKASVVKGVDKEVKKTIKVGKESVSGVCQQLILAGKTNAEVWAVIKDQFKLGDDKKYYPSWNRSFLKRTGKLK